MGAFRRLGVLCAALVLSAAACGGGASPTAPPGGGATTPTSPSGAPISLRVTVWTANKDQLALFNSIAAAYKATHPEIADITFDALPFDGYTTALTTQLAGGAPPDLAWILELSAPDFVNSGALYDIAPTLTSTPGYQYADLSPAALKLWQKGQGLYAYPFSTSPFGVFYNADLFKAAGLKTPDELLAGGQWTWGALKDAAARISASQKGVYGFVIRDFDYGDWTQLATLWDSYGASPWSADGTTCTFNRPEMVQALNLYRDMVFKDKSVPAPGTSADFFAGQAAMTVTQISRASLLKDAKYQWGLVPLPSGPAGDVPVIGQAGWAVIAKAPHPDAAAQFLAFLTNPANSLKLAQYFPPPRKSLLNAQTLAQANPLLSADQLQAVVIHGIQDGRVKPSHEGMAQIQGAVRSALDSLWQPDADAASVLGEVCTALQPLLGH